MKALPFNIPKIEGEWFIFQEDFQEFFYDRLHYHPEIQVTYVQEKGGTIICGDFMGEYEKGDLLVIGSNIPHVFRSRKGQSMAHAYSLFLDSHKFRSSIFPLHISDSLLRLEADSLLGLKYDVVTAGEIGSEIKALKNKRGMTRLTGVLQILDKLVRRENYNKLSGMEIPHAGSVRDLRMNEVLQYTLEHFTDDLPLDEVAEVASLTRTSFCRYFRQHTRKTFTEYLSELRINHACQLLKDRDMSIRSVCFESGYSNISHFNRQFRHYKGMTPGQYRKQISQ